MVAADFSEKAYETAYNIELAKGPSGSPNVFAPSQVLEAITGFDSAANPGSHHLLWRVMRVPRPKGIVLVPPIWKHPQISPKGSELPSLPVSLILQFKRPDFLTTAKARQWHLWRRPYYRFQKRARQHQVLKRLENRVGQQAIVRYAAPAFHTMSDFEKAQLSTAVISQSGHVSPAAFGSHSVWTYDTGGTVGRGNPEGPFVQLDAFDQLFIPISLSDPQPGNAQVVKFSGLQEHLALLGEACRAREPGLRRALDQWAELLLQRDIPLAQVASLLDYAAIVSLLTEHGASWWIFDANRRAANG